MAVENRSIPNHLLAFGAVVGLGAIAEGALFLGAFDTFSDGVLNAAGLVFGAIGVVVLVVLPVVLFRRYRLVSALGLFVVLLLFSIVTTLQSLELPGWILVIGLWPAVGLCYFGVAAVERLVRGSAIPG